MKIKFFVILIFIPLIFSCVSNQNVVSFLKQDDSIMYFLMPVDSKGKNVGELSVDLTFFVKDGEIISDVTANYSIVPKDSGNINSFNVGLVVGEEKIYFQEKKLLYKEVHGKSRVFARFTSIIKKDDAEKIKLPGDVKFFAEIDGLYDEISSKKFQKEIDEFRIII